MVVEVSWLFQLWDQILSYKGDCNILQNRQQSLLEINQSDETVLSVQRSVHRKQQKKPKDTGVC